MSKAKFSKHLKELNIEELRHEMMDLYVKVPGVKEHYAMELGNEKDRKRLYDKAKKEILAKYATKSFRRPRRPRIQKINAILTKMSKSAVFKHELADLYMYDVEQALIFIAKYHFYSTTLGNHISQVFEKALLIVEGELLQEDFQDRANDCVERSRYILDLHHRMRSLYRQCFEG